MKALTVSTVILIATLLNACGGVSTRPGGPSGTLIETQLTSGPANDGAPDWSPNGRTILFKRWTGVANLWTVPVVAPPWDDKTPQRLTSYINDYDGHWSPDGSQVLFGSTRSGSNDIWLLTLRDSTLVNLIALPRNDVGPVWSPDGTMVAFTSDSQVGPFGVWLYSLSEDHAWPVLTDERYSYGVTDWSPDGEWLGIGGGKGSELWLLPVQGGNLRQLTTGGDTVRDFGGVFSPDGNTLAFVSDRAGNNDIWLMDLESLAVAQLTTDPGWDLEPDWSPRGDRIVYASKRTGDGDLWILTVPKDLTWISQGEFSR